MHTLHVHNVPDDLYERLQKLTYAKKCSLSAQVIVMLNRVIEDEERIKRQAKVLTSIQRRRFKAPKNVPSSLELLHEDLRR